MTATQTTSQRRLGQPMAKLRDIAVAATLGAGVAVGAVLALGDDGSSSSNATAVAAGSQISQAEATGGGPTPLDIEAQIRAEAGGREHGGPGRRCRSQAARHRRAAAGRSRRRRARGQRPGLSARGRAHAARHRSADAGRSRRRRARGRELLIRRRLRRRRDPQGPGLNGRALLLRCDRTVRSPLDRLFDSAQESLGTDGRGWPVRIPFDSAQDRLRLAALALRPGSGEPQDERGRGALDASAPSTALRTGFARESLRTNGSNGTARSGVDLALGDVVDLLAVADFHLAGVGGFTVLPLDAPLGDFLFDELLEVLFVGRVLAALLLELRVLAGSGLGGQVADLFAQVPEVGAVPGCAGGSRRA